MAAEDSHISAVQEMLEASMRGDIITAGANETVSLVNLPLSTLDGAPITILTSNYGRGRHGTRLRPAVGSSLDQ